MGRELDFRTLFALVLNEHARIAPVVGVERLLGAASSLTTVKEDLAHELADIRSIVGDNIAEFDWGTRQLVERTVEMTSMQFSAGAEPSLWRRWAGLASLAYYLVGRRLSCAQFAALGAEWHLLDCIDLSPISSADVASVTFWDLIGGAVQVEPQYRSDPFDTAWRSLRRSVPQGDHRTTEESLAAIADHWIADSEGDWEKFQPGEYPSFEQELNAVAALARRRGFVPTSLSLQQQRFLEAGLALGEPEPLVPAIVFV